jgi:hypothetical protein
MVYRPVPKLDTTDSIMIVSVETFVPPQQRYGNVIYVLCENGRYLNTRWWEHLRGGEHRTCRIIYEVGELQV